MSDDSLSASSEEYEERKISLKKRKPSITAAKSPKSKKIRKLKPTGVSLFEDEVEEVSEDESDDNKGE